MVCRSFHLVAVLAWLAGGAYSAQAAADQPAAGVPAEAAASTNDVAIASATLVSEERGETLFVLELNRKIPFRAVVLKDPDRVLVDLSQVNFELPADAAQETRGLIKALRYGLVMPGSSRIVLDLTRPARIDSAVMEDAGTATKLVVKLATTDASGGAVATLPAASEPRPSPPDTLAKAHSDPQKAPPAPVDPRPVVVIDAGHGGLDNGTMSGSEAEKNLVLGFALALRDRIESNGKFRPILTRADDTFVPLGDRVKIARAHNAALFLSIHADALPRREGDAHGATVYTLSDKASDSEAQRLADLENKSDAIGGVNLTEEPADVADILIDLVQRETRSFSNRFARILVSEMKTTARMHKRPLKSAGFKVLKAPDIPSVLIELGYVSNKSDFQQLVSAEWRTRTVAAVNKAVEAFFNKRVVSVRSGN